MYYGMLMKVLMSEIENLTVHLLVCTVTEKIGNTSDNKWLWSLEYK